MAAGKWSKPSSKKRKKPIWCQTFCIHKTQCFSCNWDTSSNEERRSEREGAIAELRNHVKEIFVMSCLMVPLKWIRNTQFPQRLTEIIAEEAIWIAKVQTFYIGRRESSQANQERNRIRNGKCVSFEMYKRNVCNFMGIKSHQTIIRFAISGIAFMENGFARPRTSRKTLRH